jgi:hypothetical protein
MSTEITKLGRLWGIQLQDAKDDIVVEVRTEDCRGATALDSSNCIFARAAKRQMAAEQVWIFRTTATVKYPAHGRKPARLVRYTLPKDAQVAIREFDSTGKHAVKRFTFEAPKLSQTLGAARKRTAQRPGRHATGNGKIKRKVVHSISSHIRINTVRLAKGEALPPITKKNCPKKGKGK